MLVTTVDNVMLNYGTPDAKPIEHMTVAEAEEYIRQGQFESASMLPKVEAALSFIKAGKGRNAIITSMEHAQDSISGHAGTTIE